MLHPPLEVEQGAHNGMPDDGGTTATGVHCCVLEIPKQFKWARYPTSIQYGEVRTYSLSLSHFKVHLQKERNSPSCDILLRLRQWDTL